METPTENIGCTICWPNHAEAAWEARRTLKQTIELIDESHFHVKITHCQTCPQHFLSVFTEFLDWADGEDPQYWSVVPLTEDEKNSLVALAPSIKESDISNIVKSRRCLQRDYPKEAEPKIYWKDSFYIGGHD